MLWLIRPQSVIKLLNSCPRLTHLSLTGVQAFLRVDLEQFCRDAPHGESSESKKSSLYLLIAIAFQSLRNTSEMFSACFLAREYPVFGVI